MRRPGLRALLIAAPLWVAAEGAAATPVAAGTVAVRVACEAPALVAGRGMGVYRFTGRRGVPPEVIHNDRRFDAAGTCRVELEPGDYVFEVGGRLADGTPMMLRTRRASVRAAVRVPLRVAPPCRVELQHRGARLPLRRVSVRGIGPVGAVHWHPRAGEDPAAATVQVSPGQTYRVAILGGTGAVQAAVWVERKTAERWTVSIAKHAPLQCTLRWRDGTPAAVARWVRLHFPDGTDEWPLADTATLHTNRVFTRISYRYQLAGGRPIEFFPTDLVCGREGTVELGGPLGVRGHAVTVNIHTDRRHQRFIWGVTFRDAAGHAVNHWVSHLGIEAKATLASGAPVPAIMAPADYARVGNWFEHVRIWAAWRLTRRHETTVRADRYSRLNSRRFTITVPPAWEARGRCYLAKLERAHAMLRATTKWPGPGWVDVLWHVLANNGRGQIGPAHAWVDLPHVGMASCIEYYAIPEHMVHELAHNFGFDHGPPMDHVVGSARWGMDAWRWWLVDHPDHQPDVGAGWDWRTLIRIAAERVQRTRLQAEFHNQGWRTVRALRYEVQYLGDGPQPLFVDGGRVGPIPPGGFVTGGLHRRVVPGATRYAWFVREVDPE